MSLTSNLLRGLGAGKTKTTLYTKVVKEVLAIRGGGFGDPGILLPIE